MGDGGSRDEEGRDAAELTTLGITIVPIVVDVFEQSVTMEGLCIIVYM